MKESTKRRIYQQLKQGQLYQVFYTDEAGEPGELHRVQSSRGNYYMIHDSFGIFPGGLTEVKDTINRMQKVNQTY